MLKARLAVLARACDHVKNDMFRRTMIRTAMAIVNGERTLLETHEVHAFIDDIAAARTQEMPAGVTDLRGPHRLT